MIVPELGSDYQINLNIEGEKSMSKIQELMNEVEIYKQAIQDAKDALASAEQELDETLAARQPNLVYKEY